MKFTSVLRDLGRVVGYYPSLTRLTGSVNASLFLCQMLYWTDKTSDEEGWIYKTRDQWEEETGLSRKEQENARKILKKLGFLHEVYRECPRKLFYCLDLDRIDQEYETKFSNKNTIMPQTYRQDGPKVTGKTAPNVPARRPQTAPLLHTEITTEITKERKDTHTAKSSSKPSVSEVCVQELINDWNKIPGSEGLSKVTEKGRRNLTLRRNIHLRLQEHHPDDEFWTVVLNKCWTTPFLRGQGKRGWKVTLHWLVENDLNALRVYEGHYDRAQ